MFRFRTWTPCTCATLLEVEVVCQEGGLTIPGEADQFGVDIPLFGDLESTTSIREVKSVRMVFSTSSPRRPRRAALGIIRVGDVLQFIEDEAGYQEPVRQEPGTEQVHDAAVDRDVGIDDQWTCHRSGFRPLVPLGLNHGSSRSSRRTIATDRRPSRGRHGNRIAAAVPAGSGSSDMIKASGAATKAPKARPDRDRDNVPDRRLGDAVSAAA